MKKKPILQAIAVALCLAAVAAPPVLAQSSSKQAPLKSGPQVGDRPLPFTSNCVTGSNRGRQHCYICELKDETAVLVFARRLDEPTARLMRGIRDWLKESPKDKSFGWFVFLSPKGSAIEQETERDTYEFARAQNCTSVPITALGEPLGPPGYLVSPEADLTVIVFHQGKVLHNRTYRPKEWTNKSADSLVKELPKLTARQ